MASRDASLPAAASSSTIDSAGIWFWQFLKTELTPYPGRAWTVGRMTIAATIIMIIVMTFRLPYGFLGAVYTFFLSRENPTMTLKSGIRTTAMFMVGTLYTVLGVMTMVGSPITHFVWIAFSLFLAFYLIRVLPDYFMAVGFGFTLAAAIPLWDETFLTINQRTENTLWLGFSVALGSAVTVAVEYIFRRVHPVTDVRQGIETRLTAVENLLRQVAAGEPVFHMVKEIDFYSSVGTSRLRRLVLRSAASAEFIAQMNAAVALLGRLIDLASSLQIVRAKSFALPNDSDRERCLRLADQLATYRRELEKGKLAQPVDLPGEMTPSELPFLPEMERTVALIPQAFSGSDRIDPFFLAPPIDTEIRQPLFLPDAFSNVEYLKFALRGTLATMLAYVVYQSIAWPELSTAMATCIITALSTIGSSRQKQFLRLSGAIVGGFVFGMGAQVFILPYLDTIAGFMVLFAVVTGIAAWIATASPKLSYMGVQLALSFYLINLQEFHLQYSLAVARDRVVGVLLGLVCMWLIFDRLWVRDAAQEMRSAFVRSLRLVAALTEQSLKPERADLARRVLRLRDQINDAFNDMRSQSDAVVFEFGPTRERKLRMRDDFRRWQPTLRILLQVQITYLQYLFENRFPDLPQRIVAAENAFEENMAAMAREMADEVGGGGPCEVPDIQKSAAQLRDDIQGYYAASGQSLPATMEDMITLTQNLASIIAPLYADVHATFTTPHRAVVHLPRLGLRPITGQGQA